MSYNRFSILLFTIVFLLSCCTKDSDYIEIQPNKEICDKVKCLIREKTDETTMKHPYKQSTQLLLGIKLCPCDEVTTIIEKGGWTRKKFYRLKKGKILSTGEKSIDKPEKEFTYLNDKLIKETFNEGKDSIIHRYADEGRLHISEYSTGASDTIFINDSLQYANNGWDNQRYIDSTIFKNNKAEYNHFLAKSGEEFFSSKKYYKYNLKGDFIKMIRRDTVKELHEKHKYFTYYSNFGNFNLEYFDFGLPSRRYVDLLAKGDSIYHETNFEYKFLKNESGHFKVEVSLKINPEYKEINLIFYMDEKLNWYEKHVYENKKLNYKNYRKCLYD